eukprot:gene3702-6247_t
MSRPPSSRDGGLHRLNKSSTLQQNNNAQENEEESVVEELIPNQTAPVHLMTEFMAAVMSKEFDRALHLCNEVLDAEPNNAMVLEFRSLLGAKIRLDENAGTSSDDDDEEEDEDDDDDAGSEGTSTDIEDNLCDNLDDSEIIEEIEVIGDNSDLNNISNTSANTGQGNLSNLQLSSGHYAMHNRDVEINSPKGKVVSSSVQHDSDNDNVAGSSDDDDDDDDDNDDDNDDSDPLIPNGYESSGILLRHDNKTTSQLALELKGMSLQQKPR